MNIDSRIVALACGLLLLAAAAVRAAEPSDKGGAEEPSPAVVQYLAQYHDEARLQDIDKMGTQADKAAAISQLTEALKDGSPAVRAHAARALGEIGPAAKPAAAALVALIADPDPAVRRQAIKALYAIRPGQEVTLPLFIKLLEDSDPGVRMRVLGAISEHGAEAVPPLIKALKNDKACYWVCLILRDIGPAAKDAVPALLERLKDPRPEIRREVVLTLAAMEDAASTAVPQIAALLDDEHARTAATYALGRIASIPADAEAKVQANTKSDDKMLSTASLWALARVHPQDKDLRRQAGEQLVARLKDPDPQVRAGAAHALAALPPAPEIMLPIWEKAFQDADEAMVRGALDALAGTGPPAVPKLIDALKFEHVRARVVYILGQMGPGAAPATDALAGLIDDADPRVSSEAVLALAKIGPAAKAAVPALLKSLLKSYEKGEGTNDHALVYALGRIGPDAVTAEPVLTEALKSDDRALAVVSAWALGQIRPASADIAAKTVPVLIAGLTAPLPQTRQAAAESLGSLGPLAKDALPSLQKAAGDRDDNVRNAVAGALKSVGSAPQSQTPAAAAKPLVRGNVVVTLKADVPLRVENSVIALLPKGTQLMVIDLRGQWVGVQFSMGGHPTTGWVLQTEVGVQGP
jgi:HEAT repeat protein